ncbi:hypothetical protein Nepgr_007070 [Nepenthes gracilis]|uniref:Pollen Ole e 1 allergen and extensin family protein n=1 Tax=Nepenthes gracilis TaxID=150966 RepID=A0AAD3S6A1_NEPGR|nr:hypothetical protein Nepgr_007070 [Nepenthes gracilis]
MGNFYGCSNLVTMLLTSPLIFFLLLLRMDAAAARGDEFLELLSRADMVEIAGYGEEKLSTVLITGALLCKDSSSTSHHHRRPQPLPVSGALMAATCNSFDIKNKKQTWAQGITDEYGDFIIDLPSHLHAIPNLHKACFVKVLRLPKNSPCRSAAFARKPAGLRLSSVGNRIRTYTAGEILI